ncbi:hypothetical protein AQUCO_00300343v1 [Aquilegia coerulea]|uniref:Endoglucanase n=1 Tax=Aquilegia coerulea TaxID=218851 RepID=A0A2G5EYE2_AQUCA|nr:hypothetical protein AQUCO_00300343v1 [Aquilegia coerulea]
MSAIKPIGLGKLLLLLIQNVVSIDYGVALTKSLLYFEGQRSGKLPPNQRVTWRGDSGLNDGSDNKIDLVGGYYDAGDNVKFGYPMAYTITMLAWSVIEFEKEIEAKNELANALEAIKWGTDYFIKAHPHPNVLYAQVGDGYKDHVCWQRPEDMTSPRPSYKIDEQHPGSDLAAETAAALSASSIIFAKSDSNYSSLLLTHAKQLFEFARNHRGIYSQSIPVAAKFYRSSLDADELLWAAAWLYRATGDDAYVHYIDSLWTLDFELDVFFWDYKEVGVQMLIAKLIYDGKLPNEGKWNAMLLGGEGFLCNIVQKGKKNVKRTPGGLMWFDDYSPNNLQFTTSAAFIATVYAEYLTNIGGIGCKDGGVDPEELVAFAKSQVNYILGSNPKGMSFMVGFGTTYPTQIHHRGSSIVSIKTDPAPVTCRGGYETWYNKNATNPNVLEGAVVGGPDWNDIYTDLRSNYNQAQPTTYNTAPLVGVLAKLASMQP